MIKCIVMKGMRALSLIFVAIAFAQASQGQVLNNSVVWKFKTGGAIYATPVINENTLYVGSLDSNFYAVNSVSGELLWKLKAKNGINTEAVIYDNAIICFGSGNYLYGIKTDGSLLWEFKMYDGTVVLQNDSWDYYNSSPYLIDSIAYIGTEKGLVYGVNVKNGQEVFKVQTPDEKFTVETKPVVVGDKIFFGNWDGVFFAYKLSTKEKAWEYDTKKDNKYDAWVNAIETNPVVLNSNIYFGGRSCNLYCLNMTDGVKKWMYHDPGNMWIKGGPELYDTVLYLGSSYQKVIHAFGANTGKSLWMTAVDNLSYSKPLADSTYVFAGTGEDPGEKNGSFYIIDKKTGVVKDRFVTDGRIQSSAIIDKGIIYFGSSNGCIYALDKQKFISIDRPKLALCNIKTMNLGKISVNKVDTSIYFLNTGKGKDSVTFSCLKSEVTVIPAWTYINAGDSELVKVTINTSALENKKHSFIIKAVSNFDFVLRTVQKNISLEKTGGTTVLNRQSETEGYVSHFPNPFKNYITFEYDLNESAFITINIFDSSGKIISTLNDGYKNSGLHKVLFNGSNLQKGLYAYNLIKNSICTFSNLIIKE